MTVEDLIDMLQDQPQDAEVRLAIQPRWAFEHSIAGVAGPDEIKNQLKDEFEFDDNDGDDDDEADALEAEIDRIDNVVYIGEGRQIGYLPSGAKIAFE